MGTRLCVCDMMSFIGCCRDGSRNILEEGELPYSGRYSVEEVDDDDLPEAKLRRLVFLSNQNVIQSEVSICGRDWCSQAVEQIGSS